MFNHYIAHTFHVLRSNRIFSVLGIVNLAIGMTVSMSLLYIYQYESTYDRDFPDSQNIYRVMSVDDRSGKDMYNAQSPEPLMFLNINAAPGSRALIWEHTEDEPGKPCSNPRVTIPRRIIPGITNGPVDIDIRSFGVRCPPCTKERPTYGIIGLFHQVLNCVDPTPRSSRMDILECIARRKYIQCPALSYISTYYYDTY